MTTPRSGAADDAAFHDLVDELLERLLDGETPDLAAIAAARPELAARVHDAYGLACSVAGRRSPGKPMLSGYEIVRELGRGGMGTVYLARHEELDRDVALKVLPHSLGLSAHGKRRFLAEARALARLQHDHVVRIHRIVDDGDLLAFEMEYVDGPSLQRVLAALRERGPQAGVADLAAALRIPAAALGARSTLHFFVRSTIDVARALGEVHRLGIVHRDVKPSNILLQSSGRALLADFGLARGTDPAITRTGSFAGTPIYAAPEQLRGEPSIDGRADLYALAVTLYEALALVPPFAAKSSSEVLRRVENGLAAPLRRLVPRAPRDLETILQKAMEPAAADRYATADEFADDLQRLLDLQPVRARRLGAVRRLGRFVRRQRTHLLAGAAGAALVALALWPVLDHVAAAEDGTRRAAAHVRAARQHLLSMAGGSGPGVAGSSSGKPRHLAGDLPDPVDRLDAAIDEYDRALELAGSDPELLVEARVARLARWLRRAAPDRRSDVDSALADPAFTALLADLPASVAALARNYVRDLADVDDAARATAEAADERLACGLLAFLVDDLRRCEASWSGLETGSGRFPLADAILGMLFHADGRDERAYVRLSLAVQALPDVRALRLELAEAALAVGDPRPARELLASATAPTEAALAARLALLTAELAPRASLAGLRSSCERIVAMHPDAPAPRHRLAVLAMLDADHDRAAGMLRALVDDWPQVARFRLDLARAALRLGDVRTWLAQAHHAMTALRADGLSQGQVEDLLQILRLGGFEHCFRSAAASTGFDLATAGRSTAGASSDRPPFGRATFALELLVAAAAHLDPLREPAHALAAWCHRLAREHLPPPLLDRIARMVPGPTCTRLTTAEAIGNYGLPDDNLTFAHSVACAGDVDGDGEVDLLLGSPPLDARASRGMAAVISGRTGVPLGGFTGADPTVLFGYAVAGVGDLDGDGHGDLLVGAPVGVREGTAGLAAVLSTRTGAPIRTLRGDSAGYGVGVAGLGDVDGDGCPDFAVGTSPELQNRKARGRATVYSGRTGAVLHVFEANRAGVWFGAAVAGAGDVDGDGIPDLIVGGNQLEQHRGAGLVRVHSLRSGALLHGWIDEAPLREFGRVVGPAGDVDGDGHADVFVTAPGVRGGVHVFCGRTGRELAFVPAPAPEERFGIAAVAGDLDGDGRPELVVGSERAPILRVYALAPVRLLRSWRAPVGASSFGFGIAWLPAPTGTTGSVLTWAPIPPAGGNWFWRLCAADLGR